MNKITVSVCVFICIFFQGSVEIAASPSSLETGPTNKKVVPKQPDFDHHLVVKFMGGTNARARAGKVSATSTSTVQLCESLVRAHGVKFGSLLQMDEEHLDQLQQLATIRSGRHQPDLAAMMVVDGPKSELQSVADKLYAAQVVEWVEFEMASPPPPVLTSDFDIAPTTPNYASLQEYRGPNPGLNIIAFWSLGNAKGQGIRLTDCEYWFNGTHEDLCNVTPEPGHTPPQFVIDNGWHEHGTASLGVSVGGENAYGITGLAVDVDAYLYPEWSRESGGRRSTAIANAIADSEPGDIVLLEMQTSFEGNDFGPAELSSSVWNVVRMGFDLGIIVVAAAGNGNQNLDSATYDSYRARGDSGSIIVGAGSPDLSHNRLSFSTFGSRVDVQGWGGSVFTTGYGEFSQIGGDFNQRYTSGFNGTSSASAMLAGVCASLQSYAVAEIGRRLSPSEMRQTLRETGWPQGSGGNIGRFPNLVDAGQYVIDQFQKSFNLGDVNQDGATDLLDVAPFVDRINSNEYQFEADTNSDGKVNLLDVESFVLLLTN